MKRLFNLFAIGLLLAACDMEQQEPQVKVQSTYSVECASYDFTDENGIATKSVIGVDKSGSDGSQKVSNWNIWVYDHSTGSIVNNGGKNIYDETMMTFFRKTSGIDGDLLFPDEDGHYDIYILTNVEQITSVPATASAAAAYSYTFENYNSFRPMIDPDTPGGFPMATVYENFCPATADSHTFMVKRLVSKYDVVIVNDIPDSDFTLSSVKLKQGAKKINPFQENSKISLETEAGADYDIFSAAELVKKDAVTYTGELYMLENNQGQVFNSSVSTDKERIPDNMINPQNGELCTFVEFAGDIKMKDEHGQNNITFRHYFGSGRNAGVMRNINTTVTLTLKSCPNDSDEDWRIEPDDPYDTRTVVFNPNPVEIVADGSWYDVTVTPKGGDPLVLNNYIEYRLECPDASSASLSFDGVTMGSTVSGQKTLRIKSNYSGSTPTPVTVDALIGGNKISELELIVKAYEPEFPVIDISYNYTYTDIWLYGTLEDPDVEPEDWIPGVTLAVPEPEMSGCTYEVELDEFEKPFNLPYDLIISQTMGEIRLIPYNGIYGYHEMLSYLNKTDSYVNRADIHDSVIGAYVNVKFNGNVIARYHVTAELSDCPILP